MNRSSKRKDNWTCDFCHEDGKDPLYFYGKKQICEECRRKAQKDKKGPANKLY